MATSTTVSTTIPALVLPRLASGQQITDGSGSASASYVQAYNNMQANLSAVITALEAELTANVALTALVNGQVQQIITLEGLVTDANGKLVSLSIVNSYTNPSVTLTSASNTTSAYIAIAPNTRVYGDGTSVAVDGGTVQDLALNTLYYVYYSDPTRAGGAVTYLASTNANDAIQSNGIHSMGSITTPVAAVAGSTTPTSSTGTSASQPGIPAGGSTTERAQDQ